MTRGPSARGEESIGRPWLSPLWEHSMGPGSKGCMDYRNGDQHLPSLLQPSCSLPHGSLPHQTGVFECLEARAGHTGTDMAPAADAGWLADH